MAEIDLEENLDERMVGDAYQSLFPIRDLSLKTGVNSVTLRAWERRYGLLKPQRTAKGHRLYSDKDVKQVEAILYWVQQGVAVSKVRALIEKGAEEAVVDTDNDWQLQQTALVTAANQYNADKINQLYGEVFSQYPAMIAVQNWLLPSLAMLAKGAPGVFCEAVLSEALNSRLHTLKKQTAKAPKVLICVTSGGHNLWGLMAAAILSDQGVVADLLLNVASAEQCLALVQGLSPLAVMVFCGNEQAAQAALFIEQMQLCSQPVVMVGAKFWLSVHELNLGELANVRVYSEPVEGVAAFSGRLIA